MTKGKNVAASVFDTWKILKAGFYRASVKNSKTTRFSHSQTRFMTDMLRHARARCTLYLKSLNIVTENIYFWFNFSWYGVRLSCQDADIPSTMIRLAVTPKITYATMARGKNSTLKYLQKYYATSFYVLLSITRSFGV